MASGLPYGPKQPYEAFEAQVDGGRITGRVDVVYGRGQSSLDRMATALRPWGYNPRVPAIKSLNITIPAPDLGIMKLKIP
jgi:hypothetical protein